MDIDRPGGPRHCMATKRDGTPCKAWAVRGSDPPLCQAHLGTQPRDIHGTQPRDNHGTRQAASHPAPPAGDEEMVPLQTTYIAPKTAKTFLVGDVPDIPAAMPSIDEVLIDLAGRQARLSYLIEKCIKDEIKNVTAAEVLRLFALHGQNASRLGRLLRDRLAIQAESGDDFPEELAQVYDELSRRLGVDL